MRPIAVAAALALVACTKVEPPAARPQAPVVRAPVETDRSRYALEEGPFGPETTIVTTFTAPADRQVYLVNCNGALSLGLQRRVGDQWVNAWGAEINACLSPPIVLAPRQRHRDTMTVASGADAAVSSRRTEWKIESGTYRAVWHGVMTSYEPRLGSLGEELPLEQRVSAPFVIDGARPRDLSRTSPPERPAEITSVEPAHGARAAADALVRVRFAFAAAGVRLMGQPHLYVDGEFVENVRMTATEDVPPSVVELEHVPPRPWTAGRHEVRVVYQDDGRKTRWYAWSFTVAEE